METIDSCLCGRIIDLPFSNVTIQGFISKAQLLFIGLTAQAVYGYLLDQNFRKTNTLPISFTSLTQSIERGLKSPTLSP